MNRSSPVAKFDCPLQNIAVRNNSKTKKIFFLISVILSENKVINGILFMDIKEILMAILSIQSHVVYGYAGNTAAVFPMQRLGREVWAINTVEFSNHTGYGEWTGKVLGEELIGSLINGLEQRGALKNCEAVLSGYLGDASVGSVIADAVRRIKVLSPKAIYCCDPVMGDAGRGFYVKPDIPDLFRNVLIPLADIITPNQFELEALTGIEIKDIDSARKAIDILHEKGAGVVLVTSFLGDGKKGQIGMLASDKMQASDKSGLYSVITPKLPIGQCMAGSGDITASVFLSRYLETGDIKKTLELCTASVFGILEESLKSYNNNSGSCSTEAGIMELKIIQAQKELDSPSYSFRVKKVT